MNIKSAFQKPFDAAEYGNRIADVKSRMASAGFDLIICQDPANLCWLTGFDGWSFYMPQAVVLHLDDAFPIWFGRAQDARAACVTTDLPDENIIGYSEPLVHHPLDHPFDELCALVIDRGWARARIGVELDAHYYTARGHAHLVKGLPNSRIDDSRELVNWARLVKSDAELDHMRAAGRICSRTMRRAIDTIAPGVPQHQVIAETYSSQITALEGKHGDYTSMCPLIQVGDGTSTPHLTWSAEPLPDNTLIVMEIAGAHRHYHAPLTRSIHLGRPPEKITKLTSVIVEGGNAALEVMRTGNTAEHVEDVWQKVLNRNGFSKDSRVGYSIGLNFPPDWGERTVSLRPGDQTELKAGMCFHFQSGVWLDDFGAAISEPVVVTDYGAERLCDVTRELIVVH